MENTAAATVMTVGEVAERLRVSRQHVYGLVREGSLPSMRVGHGPRAPIRVTAYDLADFLADSDAARA